MDRPGARMVVWTTAATRSGERAAVPGWEHLRWGASGPGSGLASGVTKGMAASAFPGARDGSPVDFGRCSRGDGLVVRERLLWVVGPVSRGFCRARPSGWAGGVVPCRERSRRSVPRPPIRPASPRNPCVQRGPVGAPRRGGAPTGWGRFGGAAPVGPGRRREPAPPWSGRRAGPVRASLPDLDAADQEGRVRDERAATRIGDEVSLGRAFLVLVHRDVAGHQIRE